MPLGAAVSVPASANVRVIGMNILVNTAMIAASSVLNIYNIMTVLMTPPWVCPALHRELMTKKNTRIGATDFNAPTNISPSMAIPVTFGHKSPSATPMISPPRILFTRLMSIHF